MPFDEVLAMTLDGRITDAMTRGRDPAASRSTARRRVMRPATRLGRHRRRPRRARVRRGLLGARAGRAPGVLGLERFELGHANGASADHSRIIRLSYHRPDYVRLAKRAYETWAEVEAEAGERIVTITGGLDLWPADPAIPMADYTESLTAEGVPFELLDAAEVMRRWPQWRLDDDTTGDVPGAGRPRRPVQGQRRAPAARDRATARRSWTGRR